jgi:4-hydroxy-tetrahydrodipicolinate reductase
MEPIRVVVHGASGKMGREVISAVCIEPSLELVGAVDLNPPSVALDLPDGSNIVPFSTDLEPILSQYQPNVLVDFSTAQATMSAVRCSVKHGIHLVIGTSGLKPEEINEIDRLAAEHKVGATVVPNFAIGAILMIHMAKIAAKYLGTAEIIEQHHPAKMDSPSGTALTTAKGMLEARGKPFIKPVSEHSLSRGLDLDGIAVHSLRLQGIIAKQEVIFGAPGETLSIKHNTTDRQCFMPGVIMAIKEIGKHKGLVYGLDGVIGL